MNADFLSFDRYGYTPCPKCQQSFPKFHASGLRVVALTKCLIPHSTKDQNTKFKWPEIPQKIKKSKFDANMLNYTLCS